MGVIRLLLAFAVFSHHETILDSELLPGTVSVRLFFIISGFYMALILDERYGARPKSLFYTNRLLRLFPAYLVVAGLSLLLLLGADAHPFLSRDDLMLFQWEAPPWGLALAALSNLTLVGQNLFFLVDLNETFGLTLSPCRACPVVGFWLLLAPQAWSIAVELGFYAVAPFLVRWRSSCLALVGAASLALHLAIALTLPKGENMAHHLVAPQLYLFISGLLAYRLGPVAARAPRWVGAVALGLCVGAILAYGQLADPWRFPLTAVGLALALPFVFRLTRDFRPDRMLGELSYPFYISQFLVIGMFENWWPEAESIWILGGVILAALALHWFVDRPVSHLRAARLTPALVLPPASGATPELLVPVPMAPVPAGPKAAEPARRPLG